MTLSRAALAAFALSSLPLTAQAATITLDSITTPLAYNAQIHSVPEQISSGTGNAIATGLEWSGGTGFGVGLTDSFLAWCFDLIHPVGLGVGYEYEVVDTPYSNSYLLNGADDRVSDLFNANYDALDAYDEIQAAAFQLAIWEVSNDDDFDLTTGVFQASGYGANSGAITATAQSFLTGGALFDGPSLWQATFLETREASGTQNLVTAIRASGDVEAAAVPLPAAGLLLLGGLGALAAMRRRQSGVRKT